MSFLPSSILHFLIPFASIFSTKKTFLKSLVLFTGCILCNGGRTVCNCLKSLGMHGEEAFANYRHVLSRCKWSSFQSSKILLRHLIKLSLERVILVVDEHLERRRGKNIKAKAVHRDAVASSNCWLVKCWGIKWVVLFCLVTFPWSKRSFALPFFCVPMYPSDHPQYINGKYRTGIDLLCQMLCAVRRWLPHKTIVLIGDGDYARVKLMKKCSSLNISLVTRLRADARLHKYPTKKSLPRKTAQNRRPYC